MGGSTPVDAHLAAGGVRSRRWVAREQFAAARWGALLHNRRVGVQAAGPGVTVQFGRLDRQPARLCGYGAARWIRSQWVHHARDPTFREDD